VQQVETTAFEDSVAAGRRVVISSDGGRIRLRETKRGPKTKQGRRRYTGAWREPKVLLVYVVDAQGKRDATFVPCDGCDAQGAGWCSPCCEALQRLAITQADQVLLIADGAPWIMKGPLLVQTSARYAAGARMSSGRFTAAQHLARIAAHRADRVRESPCPLAHQQRRFLLQGQVEQVIAWPCRRFKSRPPAKRSARSGIISSRNQHCMAYAQLMALSFRSAVGD
jgi:hypothetical protein